MPDFNQAHQASYKSLIILPVRKLLQQTLLLISGR